MQTLPVGDRQNGEPGQGGALGRLARMAAATGADIVSAQPSLAGALILMDEVS